AATADPTAVPPHGGCLAEHALRAKQWVTRRPAPGAGTTVGMPGRVVALPQFRNRDERRAPMVYRMIASLLACVALVVFVGQAGSAAEDKAHEGKVVKAGDGKLTMSEKADPTKKHTHDIGKDVKITLDDKPAKLEDLKEGNPVKVWMNDKQIVTKLEAHSK